MTLSGDTPVPAALPSRPRPRRRRWLAVGLLAVLGAGAAGTGATGLYLELTRSATPAEASAAGQAEIASRWQRLPGGRIFPAGLTYVTTDGVASRAHQIGIAPRATCAAGLDPAVAKVLSRHGCTWVLRSAYTDASGTLVATVAAAVMPSPPAAMAADASLEPSVTSSGVRAAVFAGTAGQMSADAQRVWFYARAEGPYIVFATVGYLTGEHGSSAAGNPAVSDLGVALANRVVASLTGEGNPCHLRDVRC